MAKSSKANQSGQSTSTLAPISKAEIEQLDHLYILTERDEILIFLEENPFLIPVLVEAPNKIKTYFGEVELFLDINIDPEDAFFDSIVLFINTKLDSEEAFDKLNQLIDNWLIGNQPYEVRKNLLVETRSVNEL